MALVDQLNSVANKLIEKKLAENVLNTNAMLAFLSQPGKLVLRDGGTSLSFPVTIGDESDSTGAWYEGSENLDNSEYEPISSASFDWKNIHETIKISHPELNKVNGISAALDLLSERIKLAKQFMAQRMGTALHSGDGTAKNFVGLDTIMSTSSTYGGIAVADFPEWIATVLGNSSVSRSLTLSLIQQLHGGITYENESADLMVCRQNIYNKLWELYQPFQRLEAYDEKMAALGFKKIPVINGVPTIIDSKCASGKLRAINSNYLKLVAHKNENMKLVTHDNLEGSNAIQKRIFFMGAVVCNGRRYQGSLDDISTT